MQDFEPARPGDRCREPLRDGTKAMVVVRRCDLTAVRRFMGTPLCDIHFHNLLVKGGFTTL